MKLSILSVLLGLGVAVPQVYGLMKPAAFGEAARKFPRSLNWGYFLMLLGTAWFMFYVSKEKVADFEGMKPILYTLFIAVGVGSCLFLKDFLAVRGLAVVMLLLAKLMVDTARWVETDWRLVIVTWAYVLVIGGIWFTVTPWRLRDLIQWATASEQRIRVTSAIRLAFAALVVVLGLTVFP